MGKGYENVEVETKDGRTVLLKSDGTWEYTKDPVISPTPQPSPSPLPIHSGAVLAIKALRRMAAASEVGINFTEYGRRVIDSKGEVDEATAGIKNEELKSEINLSVSAYINAGYVWNEFIKHPKFMSSDSEMLLIIGSDPRVAEIIKRYDIPTETIDPGPIVSATDHQRRLMGDALKPFTRMLKTPALTTVWAAARKHLEKAESLLPK